MVCDRSLAIFQKLRRRQNEAVPSFTLRPAQAGRCRYAPRPIKGRQATLASLLRKACHTMGLEGLVSKRLESGRSALVIIEGEHCCEMDGKLPFGQSPCVILATLLSFFLPDIPIGAPLVMNSAWATTNGGPREISGHQTLDLPRRPEDKREPGGRVLEGTEGDRREPSFDLVRPYRQHRRQP